MKKSELRALIKEIVSEVNLNEKGRCWTGYKPTPGVEPYKKGSCEKVEETDDTNSGDVHSRVKEIVKEMVREIFKEQLGEGGTADGKGHKSKKGGLTQKGRDSHNKKTGSHLKAPVTKSHPTGKDKSRRDSFCARMSGVKGPMKKPNGEPTRKALSLRRWKCRKK